MKIIKKGKKKEQEYIMGCRFCETIFTYTVEDICCNLDFTDTVECPVCKKHLYVPVFKKKYKGSEK